MKISYLKPGNVVDELRLSLETDIPIKGGHGHYVYSLVEEFKDKADIQLISYCSKRQHLKKGNITAKTIKTVYGGRQNLFQKLFSFFKLSVLIFIELCKYKPDNVVTAGINKILVPAFFYTRLFRKKIHISFHNDLSKCSKPTKIIRNFIIKKADSIITHGPFLKKQVVEVSGNDKKVFEYDCNYSQICELQDNKFKDLTENGKYKLFSYIGRLESDKGALDILEAFKHSKLYDKSFKLVYAGNGSSLNEIEKQISAYNLENDILLLGKIKREQVAELLKKSWAVIIPTKSNLSEGRSETALEALESGVPVIAPKCGAFLYILSDKENGLFYEPDNINDLSEKIKLASDKSIHEKLVTDTLNKKGSYISPGTENFGKTLLKCIYGK